MLKEYLNAFINDSSTITETLGTDLVNASHKVVMYDQDGNVIPATNAAKTIGILLSNTPQSDYSDDSLIAQKGQTVTVLVKNIGLAETGSSVSKGDLLTINESGQVVPAAAGNFVIGRAFSTTTQAGELAQIQINPMGYLPADASTT